MLVWAERIFKVLQPQCCSSSHLATIGSNKEGLFANKFRLGGREGLLTLWKRELNHLEIQIYLKYPFFTVTKQGQKRSLASFAHHFMRAQLATLVVLGVVLLVFHSRASNLSLKIEGEGIPFLFLCPAQFWSWKRGKGKRIQYRRKLKVICVPDRFFLDETTWKQPVKLRLTYLLTISRAGVSMLFLFKSASRHITFLTHSFLWPFFSGRVVTKSMSEHSKFRGKEKRERRKRSKGRFATDLCKSLRDLKSSASTILSIASLVFS